MFASPVDYVREPLHLIIEIISISIKSPLATNAIYKLHAAKRPSQNGDFMKLLVNLSYKA